MEQISQDRELRVQRVLDAINLKREELHKRYLNLIDLLNNNASDEIIGNQANSLRQEYDRTQIHLEKIYRKGNPKQEDLRRMLEGRCNAMNHGELFPIWRDYYVRKHLQVA